MLKAVLIKLYNSWFNEKRVNLVFVASKSIQETYFSFFKPRKASWKASSRTELYQDYHCLVKFCAYVFANLDRNIAMKCHVRATFSPKYRSK